MNPKPRITCVLAALALLAACNRTPTPAPAPAGAATNADSTRFVALARGRVDVEGGLVHLSAPREGVVAKVAGNIGDSVKAGDVLLTLDTTQAEIARDAAKAEVAAANAQVQLLRAKLDAVKTRAARADEAAKAGAASDQSADDARQALVELNAEIVVAQAGADGAAQKVKQADYEVGVRSLRAPVAGKIVARTTRPGDTVSPASADLIELLPDGPRIVRAELNESFIGKVALGMRAEVRSEAEPEKTYGAKVARIGDVFGPSKLIENPLETTDARDVECILDFDADTPLRVGTRVQVRILSAGNR